MRHNLASVLTKLAKTALAVYGVVFIASQLLATQVFITQVFAAQELVYITQVFPSPSSGQEWIEIYNPNPVALDLSGWIVEDQLSTASIVLTLNQIVPAMTILHLELPIAKLNNSGDGVTIKNANGMVVDSMGYSSTAVDKSWLRDTLETGSVWINDSAVENYVPPTPKNILPTPAPAPTPTPAPAVNPTPTATPTASNVSSPTPAPVSQTEQGVILTISSFMPCPNKNQPEWVEIFNPNSFAVNLAGWKIVDKSLNSIFLADYIDSENHVVIELEKYVLNNTGDELSLLNPLAQEIDLVTYADVCQVGQHLEKNAGTWQSAQVTNLDNSTSTTTGVLSPSPSPTPAANSDTGAPITYPLNPTVTWWNSPNISQVKLIESGEPQALGKTFEAQAATTIDSIKPPKNTRQSVIMGGLCLIGSSISLALTQIKHAYSTLASHIH